MENRTRNIVIIGSLVTLLGGVGLYVWRQYSLLKSIKVGFGKIRFNKINQNELDVDLSLQITNPSDQSFVIDGYDLNIYLGDMVIANVKNSVANIKLNSMGVPSILPIRIVAIPKQIFSRERLPLLVKFIGNPMGGWLRIKGTLSVRHQLVYLKDYPLDMVLEKATK